MKKEWMEWIRSKCVETTASDLKRVLLIGDSITDGYYNAVSKNLWGKCRVDYIATSYAVDSKIYRTIIKTFVNDSKYDIIHFNHGLHGKHISEKNYKKLVSKLLTSFPKTAEIILATSTRVLKNKSQKIDDSWEKKLIERNRAIVEIANDLGFLVDDLYPISVQMDYSNRTSDGFHYTLKGYDILAESVSQSILKKL